MKIAVISDIHGNVPALESVLLDVDQWRPDKLVVNGDVINRGPCSLAVLEMLEYFHPDTIYVKGNHEDFVKFAKANPVTDQAFNYHLRCFAQWTADQLGDEWLDKVDKWLESYDFTVSSPAFGDFGKTIHITHGSRMGNRDGIHFRLSEEELRDKQVHHSDVFISSHTHLPMTRYVDDTLVMNTGSVGQPLDEDERAAYGRLYLDNDKIVGEIRRVNYDKERAEKDFYSSGFMEHSGPVGQLIFREHKFNRRYVGPFMNRYLTDINDGKISVKAAVNRYLLELES